MKNVFKYLVLVFLFLAGVTFSQIPKVINYQGLLLGSDEQPVPEGEYDLTFTLYDEPGNTLWSEVHQQVFITGGLFQVHLGAIEPLGLPFNQAYLLGIQVGNDLELEPRMYLTSSAYSLNSSNAEALQGIMVSEVAMPHTLLPLDSTGMFPPSVIPPDSGGGGGGIGGSGTTNFIPRFSGETTIANSIIYQTGGNLGIGTTTPSAKFELAGSDAKIYGLTVGRGGGSLGTNIALGIESLFSNTTGTENTAIGLGALYHNKAVSYNTAIGNGAMYFANNTEPGYNGFNTAVGYRALYGGSNPANNIFTYNTAIGYKSLHSTTSGSYNTAIGSNALYSNASGYDNTANGSLALYSNFTGNQNTAIGIQSLYSNTTGEYNTAIGYKSLYLNYTGNNNTAVGNGALGINWDGSYNTAVGENAGTYSPFSQGTFLGVDAYPGSSGSYNIMGLGYESRPYGSNEVRIGNSNVTSIGGFAGWTTFSDGRYKLSVNENVKGLDFIMKLRPVTYQLDMDRLSADLKEYQRKDENGNITIAPTEMDIKSRNEKSQIVYTGFIAQEVENAANETGFYFSGVDARKNENDFYGLRYAEFVVPLVKAVQEQQKIIKQLTKRIEELERD